MKAPRYRLWSQFATLVKGLLALDQFNDHHPQSQSVLEVIHQRLLSRETMDEQKDTGHSVQFSWYQPDQGNSVLQCCSVI